MSLRHRLGPVLERIPRTGTIADIGAGDGQLAIARVLRDRARVIAVEKTDATTMRLRDAVGRIPQVADLIEVRHGNAFEVITHGEITGAVIAGIGGKTIAAMLDRAIECDVEWLVIQCVQHKATLAAAIAKHGFIVDTYDEVMDNSHVYPMWILKAGSS